MHDGWVKTLLGIAGILCLALLLGLFSGPTGGLALGSAALFCAIACRIRFLQSRSRYHPNPPASPLETLARTCRRFAERLQGQATGQGRRDAESPPYGVCVLDRQFQLLWCNAAAAGHFGIRAEAAAGRPFVHAAELDAYVAGGDFAKPLRLPAGFGDPDAVLALTLVPYLRSQWLLLSRDVTLDARAESARRDGVADALHELCTPITVLAGYLDTIGRLRLDPRKSREYLRAMEEQCRRMQHTVGELLDLWTVDSAPAQPRQDRIDVARVLEGIVRDLEALSEGRHSITLDVQPGLDLLGATREIESVFTNLGTNAVRYTPPGGEVRIAWHAVPGGAEYVVTDTGIGIDSDDLPRLTERFYRAGRNDGSRGRGTGLGLAIVKRVLERHQASLRIESQPGAGSRFSACFPAHRVLFAAEAGQASTASQGALPARLRGVGHYTMRAM